MEKRQNWKINGVLRGRFFRGGLGPRATVNAKAPRSQTRMSNMAQITPERVFDLFWPWYWPCSVSFQLNVRTRFVAWTGLFMNMVAP